MGTLQEHHEVDTTLPSQEELTDGQNSVPAYKDLKRNIDHGYLSLSDIPEHQRQHPFCSIQVLRLQLKERLEVQKEAAIAFTQIAESEGRYCSPEERMQIWAELFSELFREICDRRVVPAELFEKKFIEFEQSIAYDISLLKDVLSKKEGHDVGIKGIKDHVLWNIDSLAKDSASQMGVLLTLVFPHVRNGKIANQFTSRQVFFPYRERKNLSLDQEQV